MESNDRAIGHIVGTIALFFVLKFSDLPINIFLGGLFFIYMLWRTAVVCEEAENEILKGIGQMLFMGLMTLAVISEFFNIR